MFPILYQAHHSSYTEDLPFWLNLAREQGGDILELGCGTGRVLVPLIQAHHTVLGLDNDPEMLAYLQANAAAALRAHLHLTCANMTGFSLSKKFSLILLPCNTYSTLSVAERQSTLASISEHLFPGGLFAVSMPNPAVIRSLPKRGDEEIEMEFIHPKSGQPVQVVSAWERDKKTLRIDWHYDHLLPDGKIERTSVSVAHQLATLDTYLGEMAQAGLAVNACYGDFDRSRYENASPYLIIQAQKHN